MNTTLRNRLIWSCIALCIIAILYFAWRLYDLSLGSSYSDGGTDFGIEGALVRVVPSFKPKKLAPGDYLNVDIILNKLPGTIPDGTANETNGKLSGVLEAPDCKVSPQNAIDWQTSGPSIDEMQWHWTIVCDTEGRKSFSPTISFMKNPGWSSDPDRTDATPYRGTLSIMVSKPLTQVVLSFLSAVFLAIVGTLVTYLLRQRSTGPP